KDVRDEVVADVKANNLSFLEGVRKGTFTVPGDGVIDFRPIFDILEKHNYKGWMVVEAEQDPAIANPFEYAVKVRKYIKETAGI
ncbi:TIM barrel protein, partial [Aggregatibacter actinomycetemcomitans]